MVLTKSCWWWYLSLGVAVTGPSLCLEAHRCRFPRAPPSLYTERSPRYAQNDQKADMNNQQPMLDSQQTSKVAGRTSRVQSWKSQPRVSQESVLICSGHPGKPLLATAPSKWRKILNKTMANRGTERESNDETVGILDPGRFKQDLSAVT